MCEWCCQWAEGPGRATSAFEHSVLCVLEIYALENAVIYIAVYGLYKP